MSTDEVKSAVQLQTRLNGIVKEVEYTDAAQGLGVGSVYCVEFKCSFPFQCKSIALHRGELKLATAMDRCTFKLSEKQQGAWVATSIRLKPREASAVGTIPTAPNTSLQVVSLFDGDSPLNSLEYAALVHTTPADPAVD